MLRTVVCLSISGNIVFLFFNGILWLFSYLSYPMENLAENASAQIYAKRHKFTITRLLDPVDRQALSQLEIKKVIVPIKQRKMKKEKILNFASYETTNSLLKGHIKEISRAYTYRCYTATFILCRKVLENLPFILKL